MKRMKCLINTTMERLKKALPFIGIILFTSCTSTEYLIPVEKVEEQIDKTVKNFELEEFQFVGVQSNSEIQIYVQNREYNLVTKTTQNILNNLQTETHTYKFMNASGETAEFTLELYPRQPDALYKVLVSGCQVSNPNTYNKICNDTNLQNINTLPKEKYVYSNGKKIALLAGGILTTFILTLALIIGV